MPFNVQAQRGATVSRAPDLGPKPTREEKAHDQMVRDEIARLSRTADRVDEFAERVKKAKRDYETAPTPASQAETKRALAIAACEYDRAITARADRHRLINNNPRALGKPWLRPADMTTNQRLLGERHGLMERVAEIDAQVKPEYPPVK